MIVGRSLPRAIAAAATTRSSSDDCRAPPFEIAGGAAAAGGAGGGTTGRQKGDAHQQRGDTSATKSKFNSSDKERGPSLSSSYALGGGGVGMEDIIAGNPGRAIEELNMRARLETVREEIDGVLKMHASMAKGERTSWLKKVERQNEENSYQVPKTKLLIRTNYYYTGGSSSTRLGSDCVNNPLTFDVRGQITLITPLDASEGGKFVNKKKNDDHRVGHTGTYARKAGRGAGVNRRGMYH